MKRVFLFLLFALCGFSAEARRVGVFSFFADDGKQIYEDENVRVVIAVKINEPYLAVVNKTDHVIYIDKGSSFVYKNGKATCLFSNSSYSSGTGSAGGVSVNLGGVASALGVGGGRGQYTWRGECWRRAEFPKQHDVLRTACNGNSAESYLYSIYMAKAVRVLPKSQTEKSGADVELRAS